MNKETFLQKLKENKHLSQTYLILPVCEEEDEETIILLDWVTHNVSLSFKYSDSGVIYHVTYGDVRIYELRKTLDAIVDILEKGE